MIEPTEGEIVDVLNNYLNSGNRDTFHQILIGRAIAEIKHLRMRVADLKNGFEGSCTACEPVAEMNRKLMEERDEARAAIEMPAQKASKFRNLTQQANDVLDLARGYDPNSLVGKLASLLEQTTFYKDLYYNTLTPAQRENPNLGSMEDSK